MNRKIRWILFAGIALVFAAAAAGFFLQTVKAGDTVKVDYTLMLDDGTVYYSTFVSEPLRVTLGQGILLPGLEEALIGMRAGGSKIVTIPAEKAFGPYRPDLVQIIEREQLPDDVQPELGMQFDAELMDGSPTLAVITEITGTTITLDANHPLAGKNLNLEIKLVSIESGKALADQKMVVAGILLAAGLGVVAFVFLRTRNRSRFTAIRWPGFMRRTVPVNTRRR